MRYFRKNNKNKDTNTKVSRLNNENKLLSKAIILLPALSLIYVISLNSNVLINKRMSIFTLIMIILLLIVLAFGIKKELNIKRNIKERILKTSLSIAYIFIFVFIGISLYGNNDSLRNFLVEKAISTTNHHYIATWFLNDQDIAESMNDLKSVTKINVNNNEKISFDEISSNQEMYENKYEEDILKHQTESQYKIIDIKNKKYNGYLVAIYNLDNLKTVTTTGEMLSFISKSHNSLITFGEKNYVIAKETEATISSPIKNIDIFESLKIIQKEEIIKEPLSQERAYLENNKLVLTTQQNDDTKNYIYGKHLIVDEEKIYEQTTISESQSQTIIGQREDGILLILVLDCIENIDYHDITVLMENYGAINAISLENNSSNLIENGKYISGNDKDTQLIEKAWILVE